MDYDYCHDLVTRERPDIVPKVKPIVAHAMRPIDFFSRAWPVVKDRIRDGADSRDPDGAMGGKNAQAKLLLAQIGSS